MSFEEAVEYAISGQIPSLAHPCARSTLGCQTIVHPTPGNVRWQPW